MKKIAMFLFVLVIGAAACSPAGAYPPAVNPVSADNGPLRIVADPAVEPLTKEILPSCGVAYDISYLGSVGMKLKVQSYSHENPGDVDVFWAASPTWLPGSFIINKTPTMGTYVVFGVDQGLANELGWSTSTGITMADIMTAASAGKLSLAIASSSQDDAAMNFLIAGMTALKGNDEPLQASDLSNPAVTDPMVSFFKSVSRGSNYSGDLKNAIVADRLSGHPQYNSFVLPESMAISVDQELTAKGAAPMLVFYVKDAVGLQSFTMGFTKGTSADKQEKFAALVNCLTGADVQKKLQSLGFRTNPIGMKVDNPDPAVFNPAWGVDGSAEYVTVSVPKTPVIEQILTSYQLEWRAGSCAVYALDFSPSMQGDGNHQLVTAMDLLLDQSKAGQYYLQTGPKDYTYAILFADTILAEYEVQGNDPNQLLGLDQQIASHDFGSGTSVFGSVERALDVVKEKCAPGLLPAVVILTDGVSNWGPSFEDLQYKYQSEGLKTPVFAIMMGDANEQELERITTLTNAGKPCDGRVGQDALVKCFRDFRGSN